ncbi:terminase large subunit [Chitinasiproducens palmae]|uniref:Phage terminase-like protein, large subunit, contains N-terminal HTH domain n=1 Tax=Chitinasiproducens palmae TaxID=1770053 RepID=A0A1H2PS81_9BURK|nr:terminase large subunit [Chitinasiproducens palmae]SDV49810.1 Phage terminase-like protein, large subunit, contains N-terminal HTH domain [Chitinasiproducens palmae]
MEWTTACPDWTSRLVERRSIIPPPIFPDQGEQALAIFKQLRVTDLPGKPTFGECSEQWVFDYVAAIFGAYDSETGRQLIREFFLLISKKNTKSTIAAGIMLTAVILCWREEEEHLILAPTKEVADNSFKPAAGMVRADEELSALFHIQEHIRTITHRVTRASLKVVAADTDTVSGKKSGRILVDELWLFGTKSRASSMFMEATGGQISRDEGWVIFLTTQSDQPPAGVFKEKLDYYRDVRDGKIVDPKSLGVLYEFPPHMVKSKAYLDPTNFYISNPNIGRSVSAEWLDDQLQKLRHKLDGTFQEFLAKHLNIEIGLNLRADRWAGADHWEAQGRAGLTLEQLIDRCEVIDAGIDGGGLDDLLGLAVAGRERGTGAWLTWGKAWAHPSVLERRQSEAARFTDFAREGDLVLVKRIGEDVEQLAAIVAQVHDSGKLDKVGVDPSGIGAVLDALEAAGVPKELIIGISQGWKLGGTIKTTERKLAEGGLLHGGRPMMAWCVGNAKVVPSGNAVLITKAASGTAKIDPLMALFDAIALLSLNPEPPSDMDGFLEDPIMVGI